MKGTALRSSNGCPYGSVPVKFTAGAARALPPSYQNGFQLSIGKYNGFYPSLISHCPFRTI